MQKSKYFFKNIRNEISTFGSIYGKINLLPKELYRFSSISVSLEGADRTAFINERGQFIL